MGKKVIWKNKHTNEENEKCETKKRKKTKKKKKRIKRKYMNQRQTKKYNK